MNVNFWDSRPDIIAVPARVKREWQAGLMAGVSSWGGGVDLEPTALYGMRVYKEGSFLSPHVDREETHAWTAATSQLSRFIARSAFWRRSGLKLLMIRLESIQPWTKYGT